MILITGAAGFVGRYVVKELLKQKEKIRCLVMKKTDLSQSKEMEIIVGDIRDKRLVDESVRGTRYVVHIAAALNPFNVKELYSVNVEGTRNLIEAAKKYKVKKFIFVSSEGAIQKFDEYGKSKANAEEIVRKFKSHVILRPTIVYGKGDKKNIARLINLIKRFPFIPVIGDGKNRLQPVYVGDIAQVIKNSLRYGKGTYMMAGKEPLSLNEVIKTIESCLGIKRNRIRISKSITRLIIFIMKLSSGRIIKPNMISPNVIEYFSKDQTYDISKTIKELKYKPLSFREGIRRSL